MTAIGETLPSSSGTRLRRKGVERARLVCLAALCGLASVGVAGHADAQRATSLQTTTSKTTLTTKEAEAIRKAYDDAKRGVADYKPPTEVMQPSHKGPRRVLIELDMRDIDAEIDKLRQERKDFSDKEIMALRGDALAEKVRELRPELQAVGADFVRSYENVALVVAHIREDGQLDKLSGLKQVVAVHENMWFYPLLSETLPIIGQPAAVAGGASGGGASVAVLDTGADFTQPAFGSCASAGAPGCRIVDAHEFSWPDGSLDDDGHGTNVSAIVAAVAPGAGILALDVFVNVDGQNVTDVVGLTAAIDYVIKTRAVFNTVAMNLSLGTYGLGSRGRCASPFDAVFASAVMAGITPVVAAGNDGNPSRLAIPACSPFAVSVGSTDERDAVSSFSNASASLDLMAPGEDVTAGGLTLSGTSMASPHVAGAWAVMRAARPDLSADQVLQALKDTGRPVVDPRNGLTFPRLQLDTALGWSGFAPIAVIGNLSDVVFWYDFDWATCQVQEITDAGACGYELVEQTVTDAAECGYETVTSAAQCGVELVACGVQVISTGLQCVADMLAGRACEEALYCEEPQSCSVPASCDVLVPCDPNTMTCQALTCSIEVCGL